MKRRIIVSLILIAIACKAFGSDTPFIKVHFLYGSKPKKEFRGIEKKWFGGIHGGHVGIETDDDKIIDFTPDGKFHLIAKKENRHSRLAVHTVESFWKIMGSPPNSVKKLTIIIPITAEQKQRLDSITTIYTAHTPYDYAFFGMRCAAGAYDVLAQTGIVKQYGYHKTCRKIFYPKKLRKLLLKKASENNWTIIRQQGTNRRKWEKD